MSKEKERSVRERRVARGRAATEIATALNESYQKGRKFVKREGQTVANAEQVMIESMIELISKEDE